MHSGWENKGKINSPPLKIVRRAGHAPIKPSEAEQHHWTFVDTIPKPILLLDKYGFIEYVNKNYTQTFGYDREELIGKSVTELIPSESTRNGLLRIISYSVATRPSPSPWIGKNITKNGGLIDVQVDWDYRQGQRGEVTGFTCVFHNISERKLAEKALQKSLELYSDLVENINDVIFRLDNNGRFTFVSPVIEKLAGYEVEEVIGRCFHDFVHPEDLPACKQKFEEALSGKQTAVNLKVFLRDGSIRYARTSSRPLVIDNAISGITGTLTDITKLMNTKQALRKANGDLEQKVESRTQALKTVTEKLKRKQEELIARQAELEKANKELVETNRAISSLANNIETMFQEAEQSRSLTIRSKMMPIIEELLKDEGLGARRVEIDMLASYMRDLTSSLEKGLKYTSALSQAEGGLPACLFRLRGGLLAGGRCVRRGRRRSGCRSLPRADPGRRRQGLPDFVGAACP